MLYVFAIEGTGYVKVGFTGGCPWTRARDGFWRCCHPAALCGQLGWEALRLLILSPATLDEEKLLHAAMQRGGDGEFYAMSQLPRIQALIEANGRAHHACGDDWQLPLPPKPVVPPPGWGIEKRPCCGGAWHVCDSCQAQFARPHYLSTHMRESCPERSTAAKVPCGKCGEHVISRNLARHRGSKRCRDSEG
jgi:hypothetical protein